MKTGESQVGREKWGGSSIDLSLAIGKTFKVSGRIVGDKWSFLSSSLVVPLVDVDSTVGGEKR